MIFRFLAGLVVIMCFACQRSRQPELKTLYGRWTLDSFSTPTGKIISDKDKFQQMTFSDDGDFIYSWMNGDVGGEFKGKYFINENPNRHCKTLTLIADLANNGTDTIRQYLNFDILSLNATRLNTSGKTEFLNRQDKVIVYTEISIFRKD